MNKFTIDGMTLQDILDRLPEIADNRARLMGYLRHVTQYALECENALQALDAPQTAGTGVRYVVTPIYTSPMAWEIRDNVTGDYIGFELTKEDAHEEARKLNAQRSADMGDESEGAK